MPHVMHAEFSYDLQHISSGNMVQTVRQEEFIIPQDLFKPADQDETWQNV